MNIPKPSFPEGAEMWDLPEMASPNSPFSTGFIRFFDMAKCHVHFIYKPNAFLIILGAFSRF